VDAGGAGGTDGLAAPDSVARRAARQSGQPAPPDTSTVPPPPKQDQKKYGKKGILQRIFGVFK